MNFETWLNEKKKINIQNDAIDKTKLKDFITSIKSLLFPGYFEDAVELEEFLNSKIYSLESLFSSFISRINRMLNINLDIKALLSKFENELPQIDSLLKTDLEALYAGDPAASSQTEIILCYPGFEAILIHRIAHVFYELQIPILPRVMSEYAHSRTGIDIHPGANIGPYFFIDHGTGIVIGETTIIGHHVKIYQGVTLGALSLREGQSLKGSKRHPTIKDNVTIYSGASIFGGDTIIGSNTTIGSNAFITTSVEDNTVVTISGCKKKHI